MSCKIFSSSSRRVAGLVLALIASSDLPNSEALQCFLDIGQLEPDAAANLDVRNASRGDVIVDGSLGHP